MTMQASGQTNVRDNRTRKNRKESIATLLFTMEFGGFKKRREFVLSSMQKGSSFFKNTLRADSVPFHAEHFAPHRVSARRWCAQHVFRNIVHK